MFVYHFSPTRFDDGEQVKRFFLPVMFIVTTYTGFAQECSNDDFVLPDQDRSSPTVVLPSVYKL